VQTNQSRADVPQDQRSQKSGSQATKSKSPQSQIALHRNRRIVWGAGTFPILRTISRSHSNAITTSWQLQDSWDVGDTVHRLLYLKVALCAS
jgi:hypothetical protein